MKRPSPKEEIAVHMRAAEKVLRAHGSMKPMLVFRCDDGPRMIMTPWQSTAEKVAACQLGRIAAVAWDATSVSVVSEAWLRRVARMPGETRDDLMKRGRAVKPAQAEDRREVVLVYHAYFDRNDKLKYQTVSREIERDWKGVVTGLAREDPARPLRPAQREDSPFFEIMPARRPTALERAAASALLDNVEGVTELTPASVLH